MAQHSVTYKTAFFKAFPFKAKGLFEDLVWPAAAGNVGWSLLQIAIKPETVHNAILRLAILALLAVYLAIDWFRSRSLGTRTRGYWIADAIHVTSIVVFGVAVASDESEMFLHFSLGAVFGIAVVGHLVGAWEVAEEALEWRRRFLLMSCGLLGIGILTAGYLSFGRASLWTILFTFAAVLAAWVTARVKIQAKTLRAAVADHPDNVMCEDNKRR